MQKFTVDKAQTKLSKAISEFNSDFSYNEIQKSIRNHDIKVNDVRVKSDVAVCRGDRIEIYAEPKSKIEDRLEMVYEDENIAVVYKPKGIMSVGENSLAEKLLGFYSYIAPCHRLDTNTDGLMIFALNQAAEKEVFELIKDRKIRKFYKAIVYGMPKGKRITLYLQKNVDKGTVTVFDEARRGAVKTETEYRIINNYGDCSEIEIELLTGKTHQIRATFAHMGNPILGDGKYGSTTLNKAYKVYKQCLTAYKLKFNTDSVKTLRYLNGKTIEIPVKFPIKKLD